MRPAPASFGRPPVADAPAVDPATEPPPLGPPSATDMLLASLALWAGRIAPPTVSRGRESNDGPLPRPVRPCLKEIRSASPAPRAAPPTSGCPAPAQSSPTHLAPRAPAKVPERRSATKTRSRKSDQGTMCPAAGADSHAKGLENGPTVSHDWLPYLAIAIALLVLVWQLIRKYRPIAGINFPTLYAPSGPSCPLNSSLRQ